MLTAQIPSFPPASITPLLQYYKYPSLSGYFDTRPLNLHHRVTRTQRARAILFHLLLSFSYLSSSFHLYSLRLSLLFFFFSSPLFTLVRSWAATSLRAANVDLSKQRELVCTWRGQDTGQYGMTWKWEQEHTKTGIKPLARAFKISWVANIEHCVHALSSLLSIYLSLSFSLSLSPLLLLQHFPRDRLLLGPFHCFLDMSISVCVCIYVSTSYIMSFIGKGGRDMEGRKRGKNNVKRRTDCTAQTGQARLIQDKTDRQTTELQSKQARNQHSFYTPHLQGCPDLAERGRYGLTEGVPLSRRRELDGREERDRKPRYSLTNLRY